MADDIGSIGFKVDTGEIERGAVALEALASKGAAVDKAVAQVESAAKRAGKSLDTLGQSVKGADMGAVGSQAEKAASGVAGLGAAAEKGAAGTKKAADALGAFSDASKRAAAERASLTAILDRGAEQFTQAEQKYLKALADEANMLRLTGAERERYKAASMGMSEDAQQLAGALRTKIDAMKQAESGAGGLSASLLDLGKKAAATAAAFFSLGKVMASAEEWTALGNRLKLVTDGAEGFAEAQKNILAIANGTRQPLAATAELYQRLAINQAQLGLSSERMAGVVNTISQSMVISGTSAQSASAALVQLGQAFASGTLRGDELNSVLEQAPALAQAIAAGIGKSVGELRELGKEGQLTADAIVTALEAQASAVSEQFGKMAPTVGQAMTVLGNKFTEFVGRMDEAGGISKTLASAIEGLAKSFDVLVVAVAAVAATGIAAWATSAIAAAGGLAGVMAAVAGGFTAATAAAVSSHSLTVRLHNATSAPHSAAASAKVLPIPRPAPVIITTSCQCS